MQSKLIVFEKDGRYGISMNNKILCEAKYLNIRTIKNYQNLSMRYHTEIFLFTEDEENNIALNTVNEIVYIYTPEKFGYIEGDTLYISEKKYFFTEVTQCTPHFYKNLTICTPTQDIESDIIISRDENIIGGPYKKDSRNLFRIDGTVSNFKEGGGWFDCDNGNNINNPDYQTIIEELCRSFNNLNSEINGSYLLNYKKEDPWIGYIEFQNNGWPIGVEYDLGYEFDNHSSLWFQEANEFRFETETALVKFRNCYALINRHFHLIGELFDELIDVNIYLTLGGSIQEEDKDESKYIYYLKGGNAVKSKLVGNYVREMCLNPSIFASDQRLKTKIKAERFINSNYNPIENRIFFTHDKITLLYEEWEEIFYNQNFVADENWSNKIYDDVILKDYFLESAFPFKISNDADQLQLENNLIKYENLFGISYSGFEVIETIKLKN
jgi:hypothetical protein